MGEEAKGNQKLPGWIWLITGTLLGALITFLVQLSEIEPSGHTLTKTQQQSQEGGKTAKFSFYNLLRDSEVPVTSKVDPESQTKLEDNFEYLLQVASFSSLEDAEQVRAELTLLNLSAHVEKAKTDKGQTWHRVIVGPFESRSKLSKARSTLLSNRYEAMRIKRKKET